MNHVRMLTACTAALLTALLAGCKGFEPVKLEESQAAVHQETVLVPEHTEKGRTTDVSLYGMMLDCMQHCENTVHYPASVSKEEVRSTFIKLCADHPEIFWITGMSSDTGTDETTVQFTFLEGYSSDDLQNMYGKTVQSAEMIASMFAKNGTDYEKALAIHDFLVSNTVPDKSGGTFGISATAYGCLVDRKATGHGYAQAYLLIMHKLGIEAGMCDGTAGSAAQTWNYVKLDDAYYWLDPVFDDPIMQDGSQIVRHAYCFLPDSIFLTNRTLSPDNFYVPQCTETACSYFVRNETYFTEYQFEAVKKALAEQVKNGHAELMFADAETAAAAAADLFTNKNIWKVSGVDSKKTNVSYLLTDDTHAMYISFTAKS